VAELSSDDVKRLVGEAVVERFVVSGMKLGLGTGSTAIHAIRKLGQLIKDGKLVNIVATATSFQSEMEARKLGIDCRDLNDPSIDGQVDLAFDGADEVSPEGCLIKGGGAAHVREKLVEHNAKTFVVLVDSSKLVDVLGTKFPVPVEIVPLARVQVTRALEGFGATVRIREGSGKVGPVITDNGNIILDATFPKGMRIGNATDPYALEMAIKNLPGVLDSGIFTVPLKAVLVGYADGHVEERHYQHPA